MTIIETKPLGVFDGAEVIKTSIAITNAGDGLSEALKVDPQSLHIGDTVHVVLECVVTKVSFVAIKDAPGRLARVHVLRAGGATMVDADLVEAHLDEQAERILAAKEEELGIMRLTPVADEPPEEVDLTMEVRHLEGDHRDETAAGCRLCVSQSAMDEMDDEQ